MRRMRHLKPREIQGCQLALDASIATSLYDATSGGSLVAANGAVARLEDQSGNAKHVTQATSGFQPLRRATQKNGLDAIEFDSTDDRMINSSISVSLPQTVMVFGQSAQDRATFIDSYNNNQCILYRGGTSDQDGKFAASNSVTASITNDSEYGCLISTYSSGGVTIQRGRAAGSNSTTATQTLSGVSIGNLRGNPNPFNANYALGGFLCEAAAWNRVLPSAVRLRLNDSRSRKWRTDR